MRPTDERRRSSSSWLQAYARSLFEAKTDREVAEALLDAACALAPQGGAVYRSVARIAATGGGLTMPRVLDPGATNGHLVLESHDLVLVADTVPHVAGSTVGDTLRDMVDLAGTALEAIERRGEMRTRLRALARRVDEGGNSRS